MLKLEHNCNWIRRQKDYEFCELSIGYIDNRWVYEYQLFASPKWVEDGEAEYEGQLIHACKIYINYCPECGRKLQKDEGDCPCVRHVTKVDAKQESLVHQCFQLEEYNKLYSSFGSSEDRNGLWTIETSKFDVAWHLSRQTRVLERGHPETDELIFLFGFLIAFCPFCGKKLNDYHSPE